MALSDDRLRWLSGPDYLKSEPGQIAAELLTARKRIVALEAAHRSKEAQMCDAVWMWNMGKGDAQQRMVATIYTATEHPNPVTRWSAREALARAILVRSQSDAKETRYV